jgi:hypothetical protein
MTSQSGKRGEAGPLILKGRTQTAEEFFARTEGRRGTRAPLDEALAAGRDALEAKLTPDARANVEGAMAIVRAALADDPLGIKLPETRVSKAMARLERFGTEARKAHKRPLRKRIAQMLAVCEKHGWSPYDRGVAQLIAAKMKVKEHQARRYLRIYRGAGRS